MRWTRGSGTPGDVVDRRGSSRGRAPAIGAAGGGLGAIALIVFLLITVLGGGSSSPLDIPGSGSFDGTGRANGGAPAQTIPAAKDPDKDLREFSAFLVGDVQNAWAQIFADAGQQYRRAQLVLYSQGVDTGCGSATSAVGPFYCPADENVYVDPSFYSAMREQLGASGDFAWAYVIAHEIGHHVQTLVGTSAEVSQRQRSEPSLANALSVRVELQADCYAGVWGQTTFQRGILEDGDFEEGLNAASAVGDDRLQGGGLNPDSFTHGTSEQRMRWFRIGFDSGKPGDCDTFGAESV